MPLTRGNVVGYDPTRMSFQFIMMTPMGKPVACEVSSIAMDLLAGVKGDSSFRAGASVSKAERSNRARCFRVIRQRQSCSRSPLCEAFLVLGRRDVSVSGFPPTEAALFASQPLFDAVICSLGEPRQRAEA